MQNKNLLHWVAFIAVVFLVGAGLMSQIKNSVEVSLNTSSADNIPAPVGYAKLASLTTQMLQSPNDTTIIQQRKQAMLAAMETDPAAVLSVALDSPTVSKMPGAVQARLEKQVTLSGTLEVVHFDNSEFTQSTVEYSLTTSANQKYELHFTTAAESGFVPGLDLESSGSIVSIKGVAIDQEVAIGSKNYTVAARPQVKGASTDSDGEVKAAIVRRMLFLLQEPTPGSQPFGSVAYVQNYFNNTVIPYSTENSFGKLTLQVDVIGYYSTTDCHSTLSGGTSNPYSAGARAYALAAGYDPANYDIIGWNQVCPTNLSAAFISPLNNRTGTISLGWLSAAIHEIGHITFVGSSHANTLICNSAGVQVTISSTPLTCSLREYGDPFSPMGRGNKHHSPSHKNAYYDLSNFQYVTSSGTYTITQEEMPTTALQELIINPPRPCPTCPFPLPFQIGYRQPYGAYGGPDLGGVSLYHNWDSLLDASPDGNFVDSALKVGQVFTDPASGVRVETLSLTPTTATVQIIFGGQTCVRANPLVTISPVSQWADAGGVLTYSATVRNQDSTACGSNSTFSVTPSLPAGFTQSPATLSVTSAPQAQTTQQFTISSPVTAALGVYQFTQTAVSNSLSTYSGSGIGNYNIGAAPPPPPCTKNCTTTPPPTPLPPPPTPLPPPPTTLLPDLTAGVVTPVSATVGTARQFTANISNAGNASTGVGFSNFFQVAIAANGGGTVTDLASTAMSTLGSGASASATSPAYTFTSAGTYSVRACADKSNATSTGGITESNEGNNCGSWADVTVGSATTPPSKTPPPPTTTPPPKS